MARGLDRYPFNSPWIRALVGRLWLPVWFAANSGVAIIYSARDTSLLYFDARLYLMATREWLAGGDPWSVSLAGNYYAAPPPSLLPLAPLAALPIDLGVAIIAALVIGAAFLSVRLLRLPWWWILFPPLIQSILSANVQALLLPLILLGAGPLAVFLKVYAAVPLLLLGRWRALAITALLLVMTAPILPWAYYVSELGTINARLVDQTNFALPTLVLVAFAPIAVVAMWVIGRERAAWLAVPALWPSQQYYYGSLAMGAKSGLAAAIVAFPIEGSGLWALLILALVEWRRGARPPLPWRRSRDPDGTIGAVTGRTGRLDSGT
jgi:hypothetical protein